MTPGTPTVPDYLAGLMGALGALIALRARERTGEGQVVDLGLYEPIVRSWTTRYPSSARSGT